MKEIVTSLVLRGVCACGCLGLMPAAALSAVEAWVVLEPQAYVVERIGGDACEVRVLVPHGQSPATFTPATSKIKALSKGDVLFGIGVPAEQRLFERLGSTLGQVRVVESEVWRLPFAGGGAPCIGGSHPEHEGACGLPGAGDPHLWMDPRQMIAFSRQVAAALSSLQPDATSGFEARAEALVAELEGLDRRLRERLAPFKGRSFFINHASLGHFAGRYGLEQRSIEAVGGTPSSRRMGGLLGEARDAGIRAILAQVQFSRSGADVLARALDVPVLEVDPLRRDYPENLAAVTRSLLRVFGSGGGAQP